MTQDPPPTSETDPTVASPARPRRGHDSRFLPGTMIDRRYRIVAPLGRGGMGEVYRADDTKLGQTVALKFLPSALENDPRRLAMLLDEVKAARQVSHPNVCRVWDAGESEGMHFLAMEYVDGEDLGSLLRRIGRLPEDRAVQVARELCAGLAAVHDQGLLHRDLKPANVMIDGRGRVRITDFGLAALAGSIGGADVRSGTPAYMSPEQIDGREVSARSDLYALGLVLYEVFTGRRAFDGATPSSRTSDSMPATPSSHLHTLDPIVEKAILRCLEPDPSQRPASAAMVAQSLPGGDPLAAAIAAGETPSPEMVAAAGGVGGMPAAIAVGIAVLAFAGFFGVLALSEQRGVPFGRGDKPYTALQDRAREFALAFGGGADEDNARDGYSNAGVTTDSSSGGGAFYYWYRRSPAALYGLVDERFAITPQFNVPALEVPGESAQRRSLDGRLLEFRRVATPGDSLTPSGFDPFFEAAGLAGSARRPVPPMFVAPVPAHAESAWMVKTAQGERLVEGAEHSGRVAFFAVGGPLTYTPLDTSNLVRNTILALPIVVLFLVAALVARRNLRTGRADARGALRLGLTVFAFGLPGFGLLTTTAFPLGTTLVFTLIPMSFFWSAFATLCYLAVEPIVRRRHAAWLASWNRLLDGRWLDPLVGRHVLVGVLGGIVMSLIGGVQGWMSHAPLNGDVQAAAVGGWVSIGFLVRGIAYSLVGALLFILILTLAHIVARRAALGWILWFVIANFWFHAPEGLRWLTALKVAVLGLLFPQAGLVGAATALIVHYGLYEECHTIHLGAWYANSSLAVFLLLIAFLSWGLIAALRAPRRARANA